MGRGNRIHDHYTRSMLPDQALRTTFKNFSTLFLVVALVTVTTHLVYGFILRDVLEIDELHRFVRGLQGGRTVNGVSSSDLERAEAWRWAVQAAQVLLLPLLVGAARRVIDEDEKGEVPTALDALRHPRSGEKLSFRFGGAEITTLALGAALAVTIWWLALKIGLLIAEPLPDPWNFISLPLAAGVAEALGIPFLLGALVTAGRAARRRRGAATAAST